MKFNQLQIRILEESSKTNGYGGFASKSCARHIERALELQTTMPEISAFLAITAEEEAATAIFAALRKRGYAHARKLRARDHRFKAGVYPFLKLLSEVLGPLEHGLPLILFFDQNNDSKKSGILRIRMPLELQGDRQICIVPEPPLNLVSVDSDGKPSDYLKKVRSVASEQGIDSIYDYIQNVANERNTLLYASDSGIPELKDVNYVLDHHIRAAFLNLIMYLLIEPHKVQNLVQEALGVYLSILNRIDEKET
ncbi:MAG: hypothetical protein J7L96_07900 [Bacteroidales bacterium]|nr:hypothetical protein [Bacteroidales bacterium]